MWQRLAWRAWALAGRPYRCCWEKDGSAPRLLVQGGGFLCGPETWQLPFKMLVYAPEFHFLTFPLDYFQDHFSNKPGNMPLSPSPPSNLKSAVQEGSLCCVETSAARRRAHVVFYHLMPRERRQPGAFSVVQGGLRWEEAREELHSEEGRKLWILVIESKGNQTGGYLLKALWKETVLCSVLAAAPAVSALLHITLLLLFRPQRMRSGLYSPCEETTGKLQTECFVPVVFAHLLPILLAVGSTPQPGGKPKGLLVAQPGHPGGRDHLFTTHCLHLCCHVGKLWLNRYLNFRLRPT